MGGQPMQTFDWIASSIYMHDILVHQRNFVNPADREVDIENVENWWMRAMRKLRHQFKTPQELFPLYLLEFVF